MRTLFVIPAHAGKQMLQQQHLLCLAMLNFEHQVTVVFTGDVWQQVWQDEVMRKQWLALKMYGAEDLCVLSSPNQPKLPVELKLLNASELASLKAEMEFIS